MNYPQYILNYVLDTIMPVKCIGCGNFSPENQRQYLCKKCLGSIKIQRKFECIGCNAAVLQGKTCFNCSESNYIDQLLSVCDYGDPLVIKIIKTFKYRFISEMADPLSQLLRKYILWLNKEKRANILDENPIIIPLPMFYRRLNWRGFNQAQLIAKKLADALYISCESNLLTRITETKPQAEIKDKEERLKNIGDIFKATDSAKIKGRAVLLVDDVCTTGATLNQCAKILKEAEAKKVIGFVIARG